MVSEKEIEVAAQVMRDYNNTFRGVKAIAKAALEAAEKVREDN